MRRSFLGALFLVLLLVPAKAQDDRYSGWHNKLTGYVAVKQPRWQTREVSSNRLGCPTRRWCGCWLSKHLGLNDRSLWLARNWARVGLPTVARPGVIVVWRNHVGKVTAVADGRIRVLSGNDRRAVRERWRSARGVIAYRSI